MEQSVLREWDDIAVVEVDQKKKVIISIEKLKGFNVQDKELQADLGKRLLRAVFTKHSKWYSKALVLRGSGNNGIHHRS